MRASGLQIEPGDIVVRTTSMGVEEKYEVIDPGFYEAGPGIPAHYQMQVRRSGQANPAAANTTHITITGDNNRVNQHSVDRSVNVQAGGDFAAHIDALRGEILRAQIDERDRADALETIDAAEVQLKSARPSKPVVTALLKALPIVGSVASIARTVIELMN